MKGRTERVTAWVTPKTKQYISEQGTSLTEFVNTAIQSKIVFSGKMGDICERVQDLTRKYGSETLLSEVIAKLEAE